MISWFTTAYGFVSRGLRTLGDYTGLIVLVGGLIAVWTVWSKGRQSGEQQAMNQAYERLIEQIRRETLERADAERIADLVDDPLGELRRNWSRQSSVSRDD